jgi:branched-chain amino acid transport system substrate-binding protein
LRKRFWASLALASLAAALAGCGGSADTGTDATLTVYVSLPLRGPSGPDGRDAADGARMALADANDEAGGTAVVAKYLDDTTGSGQRASWTPAQAAANARAASQDTTAIAYLGDFESGATRASLPVTNGAKILQVSPASSAENLVEDFPGDDELPETQPGGERTFGRVIPGDSAQGVAGADWVEQLGVHRVATVSDRTDFGRTLVSAFRDALTTVTITPGGAQLVYYAGVPDSQPASLSRTAPGLMVSDAELGPGGVAPEPRVTLATSAALDPTQLPPAGRDFARRFRAEYGHAPGRFAAYGYEAMAVILDSIDRASDPGDRASVTDAFFATSDRESVLGTYSIDELGETTLDRMTGYRLDGALARPVARLTGGG